ncbi:hypothetical protein BDV93DRAFT_155884 [Ceratobasidium sp. AG-I]|nr:hypothetical protein BDV93DRAFT_155884 [Ceratobasidium sp. AG-I]
MLHKAVHREILPRHSGAPSQHRSQSSPTPRTSEGSSAPRDSGPKISKDANFAVSVRVERPPQLQLRRESMKFLALFCECIPNRVISAPPPSQASCSLLRRTAVTAMEDHYPRWPARTPRFVTCGGLGHAGNCLRRVDIRRLFMSITGRVCLSSRTHR